jgi:endonuclease YncB( thermonuclease family)
MKTLRTFTLSSVLVLMALETSAEPEFQEYPEYAGEVVRIIDGDTLEVAVSIWPGIVATQSIGVRGIQAPEVRRSGCDEEKSWGNEASAQAERLYDLGSTVRLQNVTLGSFAGRVVADVFRWRSDRWLSFADEMIERNMAVEWYPDMPEVPWCLLSKTR